MHCYTVSNPEEYSWVSSLTMFICYSLFLYSCKNFIEDYTNNTNTDNNTDINNNNLITKISNFTLSSIKESHNDDYKQKLFKELLETNSLDRCYILYFIFKRKGDFKSMSSIEYIDNELTTILKNTYTNNIDNIDNIDKLHVAHEEIYTDSEDNTDEDTTDEDTTDKDTTDEDTTETIQEKENVISLDTTNIVKTPELKTYNSYELYDKIITKLNLNLDETIMPDIEIQIGENKYELTAEKLNFIQWIYYIGLYDYLTDINNLNIKYDILNEMNDIGLLAGNVFLRYQLFLCDYEYEKKLSF
jgi:hypothetical protein